MSSNIYSLHGSFVFLIVDDIEIKKILKYQCDHAAISVPDLVQILKKIKLTWLLRPNNFVWGLSKIRNLIVLERLEDILCFCKLEQLHTLGSSNA